MEAGNNQYSPSLKSDEGKSRTDKKLADIAGVGKDTIRNTETILTKGTPEDIKQVRESSLVRRYG